MIPQEHRVIAALEHLGPLVVPHRSAPRWRRFAARQHDRAIQDALAAAGLPALGYPGRKVFTMGTIGAETDQGISDATGYWARLWCRALGIPHRSAHDQDVIVDPTTNQRSTLTAHERIQLLREEQEVAKNLAGPRRSPTSRTDIPSKTPGVEPSTIARYLRACNIRPSPFAPATRRGPWPHPRVSWVGGRAR